MAYFAYAYSLDRRVRRPRCRSDEGTPAERSTNSFPPVPARSLTLKLLLDKLQRMLFGAKSEKLVRQVAQLELQLEELETSRGEEEVSLPLPLREPIEQKPGTSSRSLPEHLPREVETHRPETSCCPRLWRHAARVRRRCVGGPRVCARELQGDSPCATEVQLWPL